MSSPCPVNVCFLCVCIHDIQKHLPDLECWSSLLSVFSDDALVDIIILPMQLFMLESKILIYPEIGPILFERSRKARRVSISIRQPRGVRVAVPLNVSFSCAEQAVLPKMPWIKRNLLSMQKAVYHSREFDLDFSIADIREAKLLLAKRLNELAQQHGFNYNRLTVRQQKSRWGSCSSRNDISLNVKLTCLPMELMDFVILHELVHTRIKNHGPDFKVNLEILVGNSAALKTRLRSYQPILFR